MRAFGPGKVILLGEHAVVYGFPALAAPLSQGVTAISEPWRAPALELPHHGTAAQRRLLQRAFDRASALTGKPRVRVRVESDIPLSMGLGSSAALSVAVAKVLVEAGRGRVEDVALEMEKVFHGTPSGLDHTTSARGTLIHFRKGAPPKVRVLKCPKPMKLLVALVGDRAPTMETVAELRARQKLWPRRYKRLFAEIGSLADEGVKAFADGDHDSLGDLLNVNHGLLSALGVSSGSIDAMVNRLRDHGALGAKLTGAGGNGGAVIGLFLEPEPVVARLTREGVRCFGCQIAGPMAL